MLKKIMNDLELTGTCPLTARSGRRSDGEYQLPTQQRRERQNRTMQLNSLNCYGSNSKKSGGKKNFKMTDRILRLYHTPVEREIPLKRARSITKKARDSKDGSCLQNDTSFSLLEHTNSKKSNQSNVGIWQFSTNVVNNHIKQKNGGKYGELSASDTDTVAPDDSYSSKDRQCLSQLNKMKILDKIRPCHPQFAKEITVKPGEALKINALILAERLKVQLTPTLHNFTLPSIENASQLNTDTPKYWWEYLNNKIAKKSKAPLPPCVNKMCKLCELRADHNDIVKQSKLTKDVLHIDLKRLTEVRSKDWASYGHYTKVHKLRYTNRHKNVMKSKDTKVEVDEDYLSVDVDKLMDIYEQKPDLMRLYDPGYTQTAVREDDGVDDVGKCFHEDHTSLPRPATRKLRSCVNFTSRKTCFS